MKANISKVMMYFTNVFLMLLLFLWNNVSYADNLSGKQKEIEELASSAINGTAEDKYQLGKLFDIGGRFSRESDSEKNKNYWYQLAADAGSAKAQFLIGNAYLGLEEGYPKDLNKSLYWYEKSAQQGYAPAQFNVGSNYLFGKGAKPDLNKAIEWLTKSALQNNTSAQIRLGNIYEADDIKKYHKSLQWYNKAARNKDSLGQYYLARMYFNGTGMKRGFIQSYAWASVANEYGIMELSSKAMTESDRRKAQELSEQYIKEYRFVQKRKKDNNH